MQRHLDPASSGRIDGAAWRPAVALALALALVACGGGGGSSVPSGGGTGSGSGSGNPPPTNAGSAKVTVTVRDAFGVPAPHTYVRHRTESGAFLSVQTDAAGVANLDVPAGVGRIVAENFGLGLARSVLQLERDSDTRLDLSLEPPKLAAMSVLDAEVVAGSVSPDGRSLEVRVSIAVPAEFYYDFNDFLSFRPQDPIELKSVPAVDCQARSGDALTDLGPGCIDAGDGTDGAWRLVGTATIGPRQPVSVGPAGPVLLLVDRSQRAGELDTYDEHLFAAKSLVSALVEDKAVALGAFAADGGSSGTASPLPEKPVTFYPLGQPGWLSGRAEGFGALESLRGSTGGASALREAVRSGVDYLAARSGAADRPALVVLTAGAEDVCTTASSCAATAREISDLARQAGVQLWLVGPGDTWSGDGVTSAPLVALSRVPGVRLAVGPVRGAVHAASEVVRASLQGTPFVQEVRFRIESTAVGGFTPEVTVLGELEIFDFVNSGMGVWQELPFRATVPAR